MTVGRCFGLERGGSGGKQDGKQFELHPQPLFTPKSGRTATYSIQRTFLFFIHRPYAYNNYMKGIYNTATRPGDLPQNNSSRKPISTAQIQATNMNTSSGNKHEHDKSRQKTRTRQIQATNMNTGPGNKHQHDKFRQQTSTQVTATNIYTTTPGNKHQQTSTRQVLTTNINTINPVTNIYTTNPGNLHQYSTILKTCITTTHVENIRPHSTSRKHTLKHFIQ